MPRFAVDGARMTARITGPGQHDYRHHAVGVSADSAQEPGVFDQDPVRRAKHRPGHQRQAESVPRAVRKLPPIRARADTRVAGRRLPILGRWQRYHRVDGRLHAAPRETGQCRQATATATGRKSVLVTSQSGRGRRVSYLGVTFRLERECPVSLQ